MNIFKAFIGLSVLTLGISTSNFAQAEGGYLSLKGGAAIPKTMDVSNEFATILIFPTPDIPQTFDFKAAVSSSIALGKAFGRVRLEAEGFYSKIKFDVIDTMAATSSADGNVLGLMANAYLDVIDSENGTPYLGFGIGYAETKLDTLTTGEGLAFQGMVGFRMNLTESSGVGFEYRYFSSKTGGTFANYSASNILVSYTYNF